MKNQLMIKMTSSSVLFWKTQFTVFLNKEKQQTEDKKKCWYDVQINFLTIDSLTRPRSSLKNWRLKNTKTVGAN